jgi:hypothetical protein
MTLVEEATREFVDLLEEWGLRYMLIGGVAVGLWGEPRATLDVDLTIWVEPHHLEATVERLASRFALRTSKPMETVRELRLLPVQAANGVAVDLLFARWPLEKQALDRAVCLNIGAAQIRVAPLDYLLFLKLISDRPKDLADAEALIRRHHGKFDFSWLQAELAALAESTGQSEILGSFEQLLRDKV